MKALIGIVGLALAAAFNSCRTVMVPTVRESHDTLKVDRVVSVHDTVLLTDRVYVDTALVVPCPDASFQFTKSQGNAKLTAKMLQGLLQLTCVCDTVKITAQLRNQLTTQYRSASRQQLDTVVQTYTPPWIKWLAGAGGIAILAVFLWCVRWVANKFTKP